MALVENFAPICAEARPESVARLRRAATEAAVAAGAVNGTVDRVRLAVSEAATNAVLHAFPGSDPGCVRLDAEVVDGGLVITVRDDGRGMCPRDDSPGLGLGLPLIAQVAEHLEIVPEPGGGTALRMRFALARAS